MLDKIRKGLILLAISFIVVLTGCGDSNGGYSMLRSQNIVIAFIPLADTHEIAEVKIDNKALHVDIDTGEKIVPRVIRLQRRLFKVVGPDETVEFHGKNRINGYAVIHLRAFNTKHNVSKHTRIFISTLYDNVKITNSELFDNSGSFRFGDKIIAYAHLQDDNINLSQEALKLKIGHVEIKETKSTVNTHAITEDALGERLLILQDYEIDDIRIQNLHLLLKDLEPHETVSIEEIETLGDKIVIVELAVEPQEEQQPKPQLPVQISDR